MITLSSTGRREKLRTTWNVRPTPMRQTSKVFLPSIGCASSRAEPSSASSTPFSTLNSVVLPAPFGPMMPRISPSATEKLTSLTARSPPKARDSPSTWRSGAPAWPDARRFKGGSGIGSPPGSSSGMGCGASRRNQRSRMVQNNPSGDSSMTPMMATP